MIENERKYVLKNNPEIYTYWPHTNISQTALVVTEDYSIRVRREISKTEKHFTLTTKVKVAPGEYIEQEDEITPQQFYDLWKKGKDKLTKFRFPINELNAIVDQYYDEKGCYFILGEIELPNGVSAPKYLPPVFEENLLFTVPRELHTAFSASRLASREYAEAMYKKVLMQSA